MQLPPIRCGQAQREQMLPCSAVNAEQWTASCELKLLTTTAHRTGALSSTLFILRPKTRRLTLAEIYSGKQHNYAIASMLKSCTGAFTLQTFPQRLFNNCNILSFRS